MNGGLTWRRGIEERHAVGEAAGGAVVRQGGERG